MLKNVCYRVSVGITYLLPISEIPSGRIFKWNHSLPGVHKTYKRIYSVMSQLETNQPPLPIKEAVNTTSKLALRVPDHVRGMTTLDKEKFTTVITFPVVTVEVNDINRIRSKVRLERYLIKNMNKLKV
uniref:Ribosomal_S10 domain-containing protein n=1 Tax=Heterorhabditis bacteriophora TaxID=37862 RepID=A0A1I7X3F4_HETBA